MGVVLLLLLVTGVKQSELLVLRLRLEFDKIENATIAGKKSECHSTSRGIYVKVAQKGSIMEKPSLKIKMTQSRDLY